MPPSHAQPLRPPDAESFHCDVSREGATATVHVRGELDLATVPRPRRSARGASRRRFPAPDPRPARPVLHRQHGSALHPEIRRGGRQDGFSIALIQGPPAVQRIFVLTGTTDLPFIDP